MRRQLALALLVVTAAASGVPGRQGPPAATARPQEETTKDRPAAARPADGSGFSFIGRYITSETATKLAAICAGKSKAITDIGNQTGAAVAKAEAAGDPILLTRALLRAGEMALDMGEVEDAIRDFEAASSAASRGAALYPELAATALACEKKLGVAYLRLGEVENCAENHNASTCIFPISHEGQHTLTTGSEKAIQHFTRYLSSEPDDLEVRWLLNVAYQTLGKYPEKVPKAYLIPPSVFESAQDVGRFTDVAPELGLDTVGNAGGAIVDDFDNDGDFDVVVSSEDPCQSLRMFRNEGNGTFTDVSAASKLAEQLGGINCVQTDFDNDGFLDIFVMRGGWEFPMRNSLLRNNRDGTFTDVTAKAGLSSGLYKTHTATWADFDNDGWVDLFVGHEQMPSQLFRNKHDGTFEDVADVALGGLVAYTKGAAWGDYDNDGWVDLYVSNFGEPNLLFHNNGDGTFEEVATELGVGRPLRSFACWFFDYDNDGFLDIFVASYVYTGGDWLRPYLGLRRQWDSLRLYRNTGKGGFADVTAKVGLERPVAAMGANYGDLDNDGYLDIALGTGSPAYSALMPNLTFRNDAGRAFVDVTTSSGTGHLQKGHGVAFADIDNDGDEDIYENIGGAVLGDKYNNALFRNPGHSGNWISLKLVGVASNRAAIGAKVRLVLEGAERPGAVRYREVSSGGSFGASPLTMHVGLGSAKRIASIEVTWPASKTTQRFENVTPNQYLEIKERETAAKTRHITPIALGRGSAPPSHHHATTP